MLVTKKLRRELPALYSQENANDPIVRAKFFTPDANAIWFAIEFDGDDLFFGWACFGNFDDAELGYFSLAELMAIRGRFGLPVERDLSFSPCPLSVAKATVNGYREPARASLIRLLQAQTGSPAVTNTIEEDECPIARTG